MSRTPHFFILGSPKSGTTALAYYVARHPDVYLSDPKEPHFFDSSYNKGMDGYLADHFANWRTERVAGEATPSYLSVPYVAERIFSDVPDARLIAVLRNPVERAYSSWWMFYSRGMESLTFEDAIQENLRSLRANELLWADEGEAAWQAHIDAVRQGSHIGIRTYLESGYYEVHLKRYLSIFPGEHVKVIFSEDLQRKTEHVIHDVWRFIGVDPDAEIRNTDPVNQAVGPGAHSILRLAKATGLMRFRAHLPEHAKTWLKQTLSRLGKQPVIQPTTYALLTEHFAPHNRELEKLLDVRLPNWFDP